MFVGAQMHPPIKLKFVGVHLNPTCNFNYVGAMPLHICVNYKFASVPIVTKLSNCQTKQNMLCICSRLTTR